MWSVKMYIATWVIAALIATFPQVTSAGPAPARSSVSVSRPTVSVSRPTTPTGSGIKTNIMSPLKAQQGTDSAASADGKSTSIAANGWVFATRPNGLAMFKSARTVTPTEYVTVKTGTIRSGTPVSLHYNGGGLDWLRDIDSWLFGPSDRPVGVLRDEE